MTNQPDLSKLIKDELDTLVGKLEGQITDPAQKQAIINMTRDLAMVPIFLARGEDVSLILDNLKAEAALRGLTLSLKAQAAVQQAWINVLSKIVMGALVGAIG